MKSLCTLALLFLSGALLAQQSADEILAGNNINSGKAEQTLLASHFQGLNAGTLDGVYKLLSDNGTLSEIRTPLCVDVLEMYMGVHAASAGSVNF